MYSSALWNHSTPVIAIYALDCGKDLEVCETFILKVTKVLREGRRGGAKEFCTTGDLSVELGSLCADEDDIEELSEMYGPLCWHGCELDHGGSRSCCGMESRRGSIARLPPRGPIAAERERPVGKKEKHGWKTLSDQGGHGTGRASAMMRKHGSPGTTARFML